MTPEFAETDLTADGDASARADRRLPLLGVLVGGALLLSACGSPEEDAGVGSQEPSETASASGSSSGDDDGSGKKSSSASDSSGGGSADGEGSGEPVSASTEGPAENWPTPKPDRTAAQEDLEGAKAALEYSFELLQYDDLTGDSAPYLEMSAETCDTCVENTKRAEVIYGAGGWFLGVDYRLMSADLALPEPGKAQGPFKVETAPFSIVDSSGEKHDYEQRTVRGIVTMSYAGGEWSIDSLSYTDDGSSEE